MKGDSVDLLFPDWRENNEVVAGLSPHDKDAILGAGYLLHDSGRVYVIGSLYYIYMGFARLRSEVVTWLSSESQ